MDLTEVEVRAVLLGLVNQRSTQEAAVSMITETLGVTRSGKGPLAGCSA